MTTGVSRLLALTAILAVAAGCTNQQLQGNSSSYLIVDSLLGASGAKPAELDGTLSSDVVTMVKVTIGGKETLVPTIFSDLAKVKFELALKNPGSASSAAKPTTTNFVTLTRYQVVFTRTDGRNTPGVDVPYGFDGAMTVTVSDAGGEGDFTLVRIQAKQEAPLKALANGGGAFTISTIAEVTFFGTDQAGRQVNVTGRISVNFADWADPQ